MKKSFIEIILVFSQNLHHETVRPFTWILGNYYILVDAFPPWKKVGGSFPPHSRPGRAGGHYTPACKNCSAHSFTVIYIAYCTAGHNYCAIQQTTSLQHRTDITDITAQMSCLFRRTRLSAIIQQRGIQTSQWLYVRLDDVRSSGLVACGRRPAVVSRTPPSHFVLTVSSTKSTTIIRVR